MPQQLETSAYADSGVARILRTEESNSRFVEALGEQVVCLECDVEAKEFDQLVAGIYESILMPDAWESSLQSLSGQIAADNVHLMVWRADELSPRYSLTQGIEEQMLADYRAHYGAIDPRRLLVEQWQSGTWLACHQHFDRRTVERSEFFQDFLIPGGCRFMLGTQLAAQDGLKVFLAMHRAPGRPAFDTPQIELVERLTSHLQRAAQIWLQTEDLRNRAQLGTQAMDAMELGVMAVGVAGRLFHANRRAEAFLRSGDTLKLKAGVLTAVADADGRRLQSALAEAGATRRSQSVYLAAPKSSSDLGCSVTIMPLPHGSSLSQVLDRAELLVLVSHRGRRRTLTIRQLEQLFSLTPAEARLAKAVTAGVSLDAYAQSNDVGITTVKSQLRSVFSKTGTHRQAELTQLLVCIPSVRY